MQPTPLNQPLNPVRLGKNSRFMLSRLHSLAGLLPLGIFMVEHLLSNALVFLGAERYNEHITLLQNIPFLPLLEIFLIALPLTFHAAYGIYLSLISKPNTSKYKQRRNVAFLMQRVTGVITLIFVMYHVWSFRLSPIFSEAEVSYQLVHEQLMNPFIFIFYLAGVLSAIFHFTNGISTGLITWGITVGPNSQKWSQRFCFGLFLLFGSIGAASLIAFI